MGLLVPWLLWCRPDFIREHGAQELINRINIKNKVFGNEGFSLDLNLSSDELVSFRKFVTTQWLDRIRLSYPNVADIFEDIGIERYHEKSDLIDHKTNWPKVSRILPSSCIEIIRKMDFFSSLQFELGELDITDEENVGWGEIYWRIVRPNTMDDIGPLHADAWFWTLGHGNIPPNKDRIKVWIPLFCEAGLNGLRVVPGSHLKEWNFWGEKRDGFVKPQFDEKASGVCPQLLYTQPGQIVVFNDKLLHGGSLNQGQQTRISVEMTLLYTKI